MILGHNPGCSDFLGFVCGEWHRMPTAATALLTIRTIPIMERAWKLEFEELLLQGIVI